MIPAADFLEQAKSKGFRFFTGVPCSYLTPLINLTISDPLTTYVGATSEGEAVAIAAGAWLAGRETVVMLQNSGLGNAINPLTSLNYPFRIPTLLVVTWRGQPGFPDEPQHELMGTITHKLLDACRVAWRAFPTNLEKLDSALSLAQMSIAQTNLPFAFVMPSNAVSGSDAITTKLAPGAGGRIERYLRGGDLPSRHQVLQRLHQNLAGDVAVIATTGKCGRELFAIADREQYLYQVGSMGCASAMALGVALNVQRPVIVLDGDGAALMKLGNLATIGKYAPPNLLHILLNNGVYDSTGGQQTAADHIDFGSIAAASGYRHAVVCDELSVFENALSQASARTGPQLIEVRIAPGSISELGRPKARPQDIARRFRSFLAANRSLGASTACAFV